MRNLNRSNHQAVDSGRTVAVLKQILRYLPGAVLPAGLILVSSSIFTRTFTTYEYGQYNVVLSIVGLLAAVLSQWIQQSVTRFLSGDLEPVAVMQLKSAVCIALVVTAAVVTISALVFTSIAGLVMGPGAAAILWPAAALVVVTCVFSALLAVLQSERRAAQHSVYNVLNVALRLVVSLSLVFSFRHAPSSLVWGQVVPLLVLVPFLWIRSQIPLPTSQVWQQPAVRAWLRRMAAYGLPMTGWFLAATFLNVGDRYLLQILAGASQVGVYSASYTLVSGAATLIAAPVLLAAHPFLISTWEAGETDRAADWLGMIMQCFTVCALLAMGVTWLFAKDLAGWFLGPAFRDGYRVMPVVLAGVCVWQLAMYAHKPLEFAGRTKVMFILAMISAGVNVLMNVVLIPRIGYMGAGYSTVISYVVYLVLAAWWGRAVLPWGVQWTRLGTAVLGSLIGFVLAFSARQFVEARAGAGAGLSVCALLAALTVGAVLVPIIKSLRAPTRRRS